MTQIAQMEHSAPDRFVMLARPQRVEPLGSGRTHLCNLCHLWIL